MPGYSEDDIRRVREANDIVAVFSDRVPVRQRGRDFWCCCPIHEEKSPSCKIDPHAQLWHCFGCGEGGDVFSFIQKADGLSFPDAVIKLAERSNVSITEQGGGGVAKSYKARLKEVCKETATFYHTQLMRGKDTQASSARSYLGSRNMGGSIPKKWGLGFAAGNGSLVRHLKAKGFSQKEMIDANVAVPTGGSVKDRFYNRIMFPIHDIKGEPIAFGGRILGDGQPKYLNSQETPIFHKSEVLYGLDKAKAAMTATGVAIVVEGYTDVISLHESGVTNAVATLGTALTVQHIRALARQAKHRIVYLFDGDEAGQRAADRALGFIDNTMTPEVGSRSRIEIAAVTLPDNLDPADYVAAKGIDALKALIDKAKPLIEYGIERRLVKYDLSSPEGRSRALPDALSILAPIKDSLLAKDYAMQIASRLNAREESVLQLLAQLQPPKSYGHDNEGTLPEKKVQNSIPSLPENEMNRLRFEREILSLCAQNPKNALQYADILAKTQWHNHIHSSLASSLLSSLEKNPESAAADLVFAAQECVPTAASILTSGKMTEKAPLDELMRFLAEELRIGDREDAIASLNEQLKHPETLDPEEFELLFETVVAMQKELVQLKAAHKAILE